MAETDTKLILWDNVSALMRHHWNGENLTRLSREAGIGPGTCTRMKECRTSVGLDVLEKVAAVFSLQPYHLLIPSLDPVNPPVGQLTARERDLYERLRQAAKALNNSN